MFEFFSDIYFVVYKLYYIGQNDDLGIRVSLKNWNGESSYKMAINDMTIGLYPGSTIGIASGR
jgi:hypothetical protein